MKQRPEEEYNKIWSPLLGRQTHLSMRSPDARTSGIHDASLHVTSHGVDIPIAFWTEEGTEKLIATYGGQLVDAVNSNGAPLLCDAVVQQQLDSASLLLENAKEHDMFVHLSSGRCPSLDWAIEKRSEAVAKFVLDYVANRSLSVEESCCILTNYLFPLIKEFPKMMEDYLVNDSFSFEYGRFSVPRSLIESNGKRPIAMTTDECLDGWTSYSSETAREFWVENSEEHGTELKAPSDCQVRVAAKFLCIDQHAIRLHASEDTAGIDKPKTSCVWNHFLLLLAIANVSVEIFKSESLTYFSNWLFFSLYFRFLWLVVLDVLTAVLFSSFSANFGMGENDPTHLERWTLFILIAVSYVFSLFSLMIRHSRIKIVSILITFAIMMHVFYSDRHETWSAVLTSIECILCWVLVIEALLPFDKTGPLVSMVKYSIKAVIPFSILVTSVLLGFTLAVWVVFKYKVYEKSEIGAYDEGTPASIDTDGSLEGPVVCRCEDDELQIESLLHVFKLLFHACIGNFDDKIFLYTCDPSLMGLWRTLLFDGFVFIGGIVLISLMVAILSDTFDGVKYTEKAELVKCRAEMAGSALFFVARHIITFEDRIRSTYWQKIIHLKIWCMLRVNESFHRLHSLKSGYRRKYFHYLVPLDKTGVEQTRWEGRMVQFEKSLKNEMRQRFSTLEERVKALDRNDGELDDHPKRMSLYQVKWDTRPDMRQERIEDELSDMRAKLEELLSLVRQTTV